MSTITPSRPQSSPSPRPPAGSAQGGPAPQLDIGRLLRKYWILLVATTVFGGALGIGIHFAWLKIYPFYESSALFKCEAPQEDVGVNTLQVDSDDFERFKGDQAAHMKSDSVLLVAANNPTIAAVAPKWAAGFKQSGTYIPNDALIWLRSRVKTSTNPSTSYVELKLTWKDKQEVAELVRLIREAYEDSLHQQVAASTADDRSALSNRIANLEEIIENLQLDRDELVQGLGADTLDSRTSEARAELERINTLMLEIRQILGTSQTKLSEWEAELNNPTGVISYPEEIRALVEDDQLVLALKQQINQSEVALEGLRGRGFGEDHRDVQRLRTYIDGQNKSLEEMKQRLYRQRFDAAISSYRSAISTYEVQEQERMAEAEALSVRLTNLTQMEGRVADLDRQIENNQTELSLKESLLGGIETQSETQQANRIMLFQQERVPTQVSHPKIYLVVPAVTILTLGLVGGLVTLREVLDQRVKGPSDVASLPRTRVLSTIPHASEDPSSPAVIETAFRDEPKGGIAESIRQTRSAVFERMKSGSHRTLLVLSATPGAGGTSVVSNLGVAAAHADRRVLIIDANFRRPSIHKVFGIEDGPGLSDVLAGAYALEDAAQPTGTENLTVLACGTEENRQYERLASNRIGDVLSQAASSYDLVLIDVAPSIVSGDGLALADRCDATMLVVKALDAKRGLVGRLSRELGERHAEFLGVTINAIRSAAGGYFRRNIQQAHRYQNES